MTHLLLFVLTATVGASEYRVHFPDRELVVTASAARFRVDGPGVGYDALLADGPIITALNSKLHTWFRVEHPLALSSRYLTPVPKAAIRNGQWRMTGADGRYVGRLSYEVRSGRAIVDVVATIDVQVDPSLPRSLWPGRILPVTGYPSIDEKLAESDPAINGFPKRMVLNVSRTYRGGPRMTDSMIVTTSDVRAVEIDESRFERPANYRLQPPVILAPASSSNARNTDR